MMFVLFGNLMLEVPCSNMVLPQFFKLLISVESSRTALPMANKVDKVGTQAVGKSPYLFLNYAIIKVVPHAQEGLWLFLS